MTTNRDEGAAVLVSLGATSTTLESIVRGARERAALDVNPEATRLAYALGFTLERPTTGERVTVKGRHLTCRWETNDPRESELNVLLGTATGLLIEHGITPRRADVYALAGLLAMPEGQSFDLAPYLPEWFVAEHVRGRGRPALRLVSG